MTVNDKQTRRSAAVHCRARCRADYGRRPLGRRGLAWPYKAMSAFTVAFGGKADMTSCTAHVRF